MTQQEINNASMLKVGTILRGTYRIDSYLSSGGFGNTYVATNVEFEERVAIKEFFMKGVTQRDDNQTTVSVSNLENTNSFQEQKEKFKKEARRIRQLKNEHIVNVHDLFEENGTAYYVMDFVDGENLSEWLKRTGRPMTESEVRIILPQILDALKAVHAEKMWHLDLKPANIMLEKGGKVKLIDFGASKQLNAQKGGATTSTAISYTNGYAPREQMEQNYDKFGPWTDIYALGATLYNLLTNKRPPLPSDIDDDVSEDKHNALPFPDGVSDLRILVLQMMKTNRLQRPQTVDSVIIALHQMLPYRQQILSGEETMFIDDERNILADCHEETGTKQNNELQVVNTKKNRKKKIVLYVCSTILLLLLIIVGYHKYQDYCLSKIRISEVLTNNTCSIVDDYGNRNAWIEIENSSAFSYNIGGLYLTSDRGCLDRNLSTEERIKRMSIIPENNDRTKIEANKQILFFCNSNPAQGTGHLSLPIPLYEPVWIALYDKTASHIIDSVTIPALAENQSYIRRDNMWIVGAPEYVTPGTRNIINKN